MALPLVRKSRKDSKSAQCLLLFASRDFFLIAAFLAGVMLGTTLETFDSVYDNNLETNLLEFSTVKVNDGWKTLNVFYGSSDIFESTLPKDQKYFSQVRQDELILKLLRNKTNGYFVDLASNDATILSNSYALEKHYGWKGLCIEPNPAYWYNLTHARRNCELVAAVVGQNRMDELHFKYDGLEYGGIVGKFFDNKERYKSSSTREYTVTLAEIFGRFDVPHIIDYMSLDVEGAEEFIMTTFPLSSYRIRILTVERPKENLQKLLESHGYEKILRVSRWGETLWVHESFKESMDMTNLEEFKGQK